MFVVHVMANAALSSLIFNTLTAWCMVYNVTKTVSTLLFFLSVLSSCHIVKPLSDLRQYITTRLTKKPGHLFSIHDQKVAESLKETTHES